MPGYSYFHYDQMMLLDVEVHSDELELLYQAADEYDWERKDHVKCALVEYQRSDGRHQTLISAVADMLGRLLVKDEMHMNHNEHRSRQTMIVEEVLSILRNDDRVLGIAAIGSYAREEHDAFSDFDIGCYLRDEERTGRQELYDQVGAVARCCAASDSMM